MQTMQVFVQEFTIDSHVANKRVCLTAKLHSKHQLVSYNNPMCPPYQQFSIATFSYCTWLHKLLCFYAYMLFAYIFICNWYYGNISFFVKLVFHAHIAVQCMVTMTKILQLIQFICLLISATTNQLCAFNCHQK